MKSVILGIVSLIAFSSPVPVAADSERHSWNFDRDALGMIARDFSVEVGQWEVVADATAPSKDQALAQRARNSMSTFNVALARDASLQDVDIVVSFKAIGGRIDRGGGPIWRAQDASNYYIARFNPLEDNYRVYKVVDGRRTELGTTDVDAAPGWHDIRITMIGNHIRGYFDGQKHLDVHDDTFAEPGRVGLWTKADAQTHFDDFRVRVPSTPLRWESSFTSTPPQIDGTVDTLWERSKPLTVEVREALGGHNPRRVVLRALHTDERIYVLAQWPDTSRSDMRDPYIWNAATNTYDRPSKPDDQFALEFRLSGDFTVSMLPDSSEYVADVWHWKAGRGDPVGWVDDKRHVISQRPTEGARVYSMGGRGTVYIARLADEGLPSYVLKPAPATFDGAVVNSFASQQPSGSLADVRGKGAHDGDTWTLEMSRALNTQHADDVTLDPRDEILCAVAVLDDELYWRHSVSPLIELHFLPPKEEQ